MGPAPDACDLIHLARGRGPICADRSLIQYRSTGRKPKRPCQPRIRTLDLGSILFF